MKKPNKPVPATHRLPASQVIVAWTALAFLATPALAEKADRDKPIHLAADQANVDDMKQLATFTGNVTLTQGTLVIRADRMVVKQDAEGFQYGTAYGNPATFRQKREGAEEYVEGRGERLEYDGRADKVQFFNRARMSLGRDEVSGSYISYDAKTEFFQVIGGGEASTETNPRGRVRAIIQPKSKPQATSPAAAPVAIKPAESLNAPQE